MRIISDTYTSMRTGIRLPSDTLWAKVDDLLGISLPMTGTTTLMIHSVLEEKSIVSNHLAV